MTRTLLRTPIHTTLASVAFLGTLALFATAASSADVVILKDGFVLQGHVGKETTSMVDPATGRTFPVVKNGGFELLDQGPNVVIYSEQFKQKGEVSKDVVIRPEYKAYKMKFYGRKGSEPIPQVSVVKSTTDYDAKWFRKITVTVPLPGSVPMGGPVPTGFDIIEEQITYIDPYYTYMVSPTHLWRSAYRTSEFDPLKIRKLFATHPELAEASGMPDAAKRIAIAKFMLDVGWLKDAKDDLEQIRKLFPDGVPKDAKEAYEKLVKDIDSATVNLVIKEAELALGAARYRYAADLRGAFPEKLADAKQLDDVTKLWAQLQTVQERFESGQRLLRTLLDEVTGLNRARPALAVCGGLVSAVWPSKALSSPLLELVAAGEKVYAELHPDTAHRLETFVNLAAQSERERLQGRDPTKKQDELLATAISGWSLGKNGSNPDPAQSLKIWTARETILGYQRTEDLNTRNAIIKRLKKATPVPIDVLAQIISLLPPADPENLAKRTGTLVPPSNRMPAGVYKRTTQPTADQPIGIPYYVKLPPEYHHGRAYPVLIVLGSPSFDIETLIGTISREADRNGYIILAPDWANQFGAGWKWQGDQHKFVTNVLREAVKHFCIDNDRVFMLGVGDGANMAMDIGMSHPDLFAGVIPISPIPKWKNMFEEYWKNGQALPFFIITGELAGDSVKTLRQITDRWMPRGYQSLMMVYKGRGAEFFSAEIPGVFDWMGRKRRVSLTGVLKLDDKGRQPWTTMRATDNHFYWLGVDKMQNQRMIENAKGSFVPATIQGDISGNNAIRVTSQGVFKFSIYLTSDLIDWTKGVTVVINNVPAQGYFRPKMLEPNLELLLEDYRERGDRRNLLWGKLEFSTTP